MGDTVLDRYTVGSGKIIPVDHTGPASYATGGETLGTTNNFTGISVVGLGSLDMVLGSGSLSDSGNYQVQVQPSGTGVRKTFKLLWFAASGTTGSAVAGTTITAPGTYTGTVPSVTFSAAPAGGTTATGTAVLNEGGTAVVAIVLTNPGSGYISAPTIAFGAGGATATATLGPAGGGNQVASATNLSAETVRLGYVGK